MENRAVVASFFACWRVQDLEMALSHLHDDVVYTLHNGPGAEPFAGSHYGIEKCRELGYTVLAEFDYLRYEPTILKASGDIVLAHVGFSIRHRATGHVIEGTQRSVFRLKDDRIVQIDVYEDAARMQAFMRLMSPRPARSQSLPENPIGRTPSEVHDVRRQQSESATAALNRSVVTSFFASWGVQDVESTAEHFHPDMIYELHVPKPLLPVSGVTRGKEACRNALFLILKDFDYLKYEPTINSVNGNTVRAGVAFKYRHRPTGEILEGTRRLVFKLRGGLIVRIDGYHDARLVEVFARLMKQREATSQGGLSTRWPAGRQPQGSDAES